MAQWPDNRQFRVVHIASARSGGHITTFAVDMFLIRDRDTPQGQALRELIGTLSRDDPPALGDKFAANAILME
ncbi:hypothetical protein [Thiocapsa sp.]|uniref:hypothetical protein n=1 Tax=Thiocapsa sp. TaxID=2024551 RepID=UPI003593E33F